MPSSMAKLNVILCILQSFWQKMKAKKWNLDAFLDKLLCGFHRVSASIVLFMTLYETCNCRGGKAYLPPATKLGQGYVFTGMCDSVHKGGVCLSACWDAPPGSRHPPGTMPPGSRHPPEQTPPPRSRHPSRSRHPPVSRHPLEQTPPEETPSTADTPPGADTPPIACWKITVNARAVRILLECNLVCYCQ